MQVVPFPARQPRIHYRHELRTLTYVTLDDANGGIVRNLNHEGVAVQAVAPLRQQQRVRLRFELRFPRLRVDAYGEVSWATPAGQCGIRFVELPASIRHQINEWIFSNLLAATREDSIFGGSVVPVVAEPEPAADHDGLTLSVSPNPPIRFDPIAAGRHEASALSPHRHEDIEEESSGAPNSGAQLNWLSRPLSGRTLAWIVDGLVMLAGLLLFALIFLSVAHELPQWPLTVCAALAAAVFVFAAYRIVFAVFGEASLGARLAHTAPGIAGDEEADRLDRFR
jgi:PilZ domain